MEAMSKYEPSKEDLAILEEFKNISDKETLVDEDDVVEDELSKE